MKQYNFGLIILFILQIIFLMSFSFTLWPEMLSFPYFVNNGLVLYKDLVFVYTPLSILPQILFFKIGFVNPFFLKLFFIFYKLITLLVFIKVFEVINLKKDLKVILYGLFLVILMFEFVPNSFWPDSILSLYLIIFIFYYIRSRFFLAGLFLGLCFLTKQTSIIFFPPSLLLVLIYERNLKILLNYILGFVVPVTIFILYLVTSNTVGDFYRWAIYYPLYFWREIPGYLYLLNSKREMIFMFIVNFPIFLIVLKRNLRNKISLSLVIFSLLSLFLMFPRYTPIHLSSNLIISVLLWRIVLNKFTAGKQILILILIILMGYFIIKPSFKFSNSIRFFENSDLKISNTLNEVILKSDNVYLLGLHSGLYFSANLLPPTPWLDNYPWYFEIQNESMNTLNKWNSDKNPEYIIKTNDTNKSYYDIDGYRSVLFSAYLNSFYEVNRIDNLNLEIWKRIKN